MIQRAKSLADINAQAWQVLIQHFGVVDALRFVGQFDMGSGDYSKDRDAWQEGVTVEQIAANIMRQRKVDNDE